MGYSVIKFEGFSEKINEIDMYDSQSENASFENGEMVFRIYENNDCEYRVEESDAIIKKIVVYTSDCETPLYNDNDDEYEEFCESASGKIFYKNGEIENVNFTLNNDFYSE